MTISQRFIYDGDPACHPNDEHACPVRHPSAHVREEDVALNDTCRAITGCVKPTLLSMLHIAPPPICRDIASALEKGKQGADERHRLFAVRSAKQRLKNEHSFLQPQKN